MPPTKLKQYVSFRYQCSDCLCFFAPTNAWNEFRLCLLCRQRNNWLFDYLETHQTDRRQYNLRPGPSRDVKLRKVLKKALKVHTVSLDQRINNVETELDKIEQELAELKKPRIKVTADCNGAHMAKVCTTERHGKEMTNLSASNGYETSTANVENNNKAMQPCMATLRERNMDGAIKKGQQIPAEGNEKENNNNIEQQVLEGEQDIMVIQIRDENSQKYNMDEIIEMLMEQERNFQNAV